MPFKINHFPSKQKPDPVRTVYEPLQYFDSVSYDRPSRYTNLKLIRKSHNMHPNKFVPQSFENTRAKTYHATARRRDIIESSTDSFHIINTNTEDRLDRIAQQYYGDASLWWVIADANPSIRFNPMSVPRGISIRIPSITTLYSTGGVLNARTIK